MTWPKTLWHLVHDRFFPNWTQGVLSGVQLVLALLAVLGVYVKIFELPEQFAIEVPARFQSYLWFTFFASVVFTAIAALLIQRLLRSHDDEKKAKSILARVSTLQHKMAEAVRLAASRQSKFDGAYQLEVVLGTQLAEYLKARLGDHEFHCTVKIIPTGKKELIDVFRDSAQDVKMRPRGKSEDLESNHLYRRLSDPTAGDAKQTYIPDVKKLPGSRELKVRANERGYRSVLAFPLNEPVIPGKIVTLIGFLGMDSPDPHAFDGLFKIAQIGDTDGDGTADIAYNPLDEMNLFYGLADAVATVCMLVQSSGIDAPAPGVQQ